MRSAVVTACVLLLAAALCATPASAYFYIPGTIAREYDEGALVNITVNSLRSLSQVVPYDYYKLPFCRPSNVADTVQSEAMGQILSGDKMEGSLYSLPMKKNIACRTLCANAADIKAKWDVLQDFIEKSYRGHMSIDNLPGFTPLDYPLAGGRCKNLKPPTVNEAPVRGYAIGVPKWCTGKTLLNNHLEFRVKYHKPEGQANRVVGFRIIPRSVAFNNEVQCDDSFNFDNSVKSPLEMDAIKDGSQEPKWTYSVTWEEDNKTTWATRWDEYLNTSVADVNARVHWVYIINSILITVCLCVIAGMMLARTLHKECNEYNANNADALAEEMGWKLVHADVFRPPQHAQFLAIAVGNGMQLLLLATAVLVFALLGFLSPANRGGILTTLLICFALFSMASGYVTARMLNTVAKREWKVIFGSATLFPGALFFCFIFIDLVNWHLGASDAVPFSKICLILLLWFGSCVPLNVLGAAYGFHVEPYKHPCPVGKLPREIPAQRWWLTAPWLYILPASLPFCAVFLELRFIFDSLWLGMVYYAFTFLTIIFVVWVATVVLSTVITVYYLLAFGDYRWWWRSFIIGGGLGFHIFLYAIWFFFTGVNITSKTGALIYFVYMGFFAAAYGLAAGTIGFLTCYAFVIKIYGSIRID